MTTTTTTLTNGTSVELGCYIDGHWGQYGPDRLADVAESLLGDVATPAADTIRVARERIDAGDYDGDHLEILNDAADELEQLLNGATPASFVWHWHDGEFFLSPLCDDLDCTDETCAHWA
jgi:hypothetical protein